MTDIETTVDGATATVWLNRPDAMNAVTIGLAHALETALREVGRRPDIHLVTLRGRGGNFCAGGDFNEVASLRAQGETELARLFDTYAAAIAAVAEIPQPVLAAVEGVAVAGGFELMLASDLAAVSHDARLSDKHVTFGLIPGGGSTQLLPRLIGRQQATAHLLLGETIRGHEAVTAGLAQFAWPADTFDQQLRHLISRLADRPRSALVQIKRLVREGLEQPLADGLAAERRAVVLHLAGPAGAQAIGRFQKGRT